MKKYLFKILFPIKNILLIFVRKRLLPFKRDWPQKRFFGIFPENYIFFFEKFAK